MRRIVALCFVLAAAGASAARAEEGNPAGPTDADRDVIAACIAKAGDEGASAFRCFGVVSDPCLAEPGNDTTVMMGACLERETAIWDERLNDDYQALLAGLEGGAKDKLRAGQKAWLTVRDTTCEVESGFWLGGTGFGGALAGCRLRETGMRDLSLVALRAYLEK